LSAEFWYHFSNGGRVDLGCGVWLMRTLASFLAGFVVGVSLCAGEVPDVSSTSTQGDSHRVVEAIARLKLPARAERLQALETIKRFPDKAIPYLVKAARDEDPVLRARVANALSLVGKGERTALWAIGILLKDPDTFVRREAIAALVKAGDASHVPQIEAMLADQQEPVRADAVVAIADLEPARAAERLKAFLAHADARVRRTAMAELLSRKDPALAEIVPRMLKDPDPGVRGDAVAALARLRAKDSVPTLIDLLGDAAPYVRVTTIAALKDLQAGQAAPRLIGLLNDPSEEVRAEAISALGSLHVKAAIPALVAQLAAPSKLLRERAAFTLGLFRDAALSAAPDLISLLADADEGVRQKADLALRLILRTNVGFQPGAAADHRQQAIAKWQEAVRKAKTKGR